MMTPFAHTIKLRPLSVLDADFMVQLLSVPEVAQQLEGVEINRHNITLWIQSLTENDFHFIILADNTPVGECSINCHGKRAEAGIMMLPSAGDQAYSAEVMRQLLDIARAYGVTEVSSEIDASNQDSIQVLQAAGFTQESIQRPPHELEDNIEAIARYVKKL